jgi:hypothetical protein
MQSNVTIKQIGIPGRVPSAYYIKCKVFDVSIVCVDVQYCFLNKFDCQSIGALVWVSKDKFTSGWGNK